MTTPTTPRLGLPHLLVLLAALYLVGVVLARSADLVPLGTALANGSELNTPAPIILAQLLGGAVAVRASGARALAGAGLLLAACTLSLAAVAFDGDLGADGL